MLGPFPASGAGFVLSEPAGYDLAYGGEVTNQGKNQVSRAVLLIPLIQDEKPYFFISNVKISPAGYKIEQDQWGNRLIRLVLPPLLPGEKFKASVHCRIQNYQVIYPVDFETLGKAEAFPAYVRSCLKEDELNPIHDGLIRKTAREIAAGEENPYLRALRVYDYLSKEFHFDQDIEPSGPIKALKSRQAQCCDTALLYTSLCRVLGIPTRYTAGLFLGRIPTLAQGGGATRETHAWAENYFPSYGWVPVDPSLGRFDSQSRYYCFAQQRNIYIPLWRGMRDAPHLSFKGEDEALKLDFFARVKVLKDSLSTPIMVHQAYWEDGLRLVGRGSYRMRPLLPKAKAKYSEAERSMEGGDYDQAAALFRDTLFLNPTWLPALQGLVKAAYRMGRLEEMEKELSDSLKNKGENPLAYYGLGLCYTYLGRYGRAVREFRKAQRAGLESSDLHNTLGYIFLETKQVPKAYGELLRAQELNSRSRLAFSNLLSLFHRLGEPEGLLSWGRKALLKFPADPEFLAETGYGYLMKNDAARAANYFEKAAAKVPSNGYYRCLLGAAHLRSSLKQQGLEEIRKGLELGVPDAEKFYFTNLLKKK
ncbi:MAG: transglutaminase domain-containing protein [bacterium]